MRGQQPDQRARYFSRLPIHSLIHKLQYQPIGVAVHDESGQQIAFGVNQAVGIRT